MVEVLLEYLLIFCFCATAGWLLEVIYRGIRHRKVVNPGFLSGCCLPIYGIGGAILYLLSGLKLRALPNEPCRVAVILLSAMAIMTLIELVGGLIALRYFRVRLWDYSNERLNYKGVICLKFSLIWGGIGAGYYFLLYPFLYRMASRTPELLWLVLCLGIYVGVFLVDLAHSLRLMQRLRHYAQGMRTHLNLDQLKVNAREYFKRETGTRRTPFDFQRMLTRYLGELHDYHGQIQEKWGKKK